MRVFIFLIPLLFTFVSLQADFPEYETNPYAFSIQDSIWGYWSCFFAADLNGDSLLDFTYRSRTALYAYDHYGNFMWSAQVPYPGPYINNHCAKHAAADVDGDGQTEIVALNNSNQVVIFNGSNGLQEDIFSVSVGAYQNAGHVAVVNLRGAGDSDILVQTMDVTEEGGGKEYYLNRSLIAHRLDTHLELWRVEQDRDTANGIYEGYWGPAHGPFAAADVDGDGRDEVVGADMIDHDGRVVPLSYPAGWIAVSGSFIDHIDAVHVGDFRPDLPGLEWIVTEEDNVTGPTEYNAWNTTLLSASGILWRKETTLFPTENEKEREPQNAAAGNFSEAHGLNETWLSSRGPIATLNHQHPWVFDSCGTQIADYNMADRLPSGFNSLGNTEGIEPIFTIDWFGERTDQIAAVARHVDGNFGVFDAMTGTAYWTTTGSVPPTAASMMYVADVSGDAREEIIVYDMTDLKVKIFWNGQVNSSQPKTPKWDDPLYRRLKQNWNYYQPGGYTYGDYPLIFDIQIQNVTTGGATLAWTTDVPSDSRVEYGETALYGSETVPDPAMVTAHSVTLTGLDPYTETHFRVKSDNEYGKTGLSADTLFRTRAVLFSVNLFMEGPYRYPSDTMSLALNNEGFLPLQSPYAEDGTTAPLVPGDAVDWVLIQLRTRPDSAAVLSRSAFLCKDGRVVDPDSSSDVMHIKAHPGNYYVIVKHRNHLGVMSAERVGLSSSTPAPYDFASAPGQTYGSEGSKQLKPGLWGMWAGDVNRDGQTTTMDYTAWYNAARQGASGYSIEDVNLDCQVTTMDYTIWYNNARTGASSKIP